MRSGCWNGMMVSRVAEMQARSLELGTFPEVGSQASWTSPSSSQLRHGLGRTASVCSWK